MLEIGFAESVEEILAASYSEDNPNKPQMLLFSGKVHFIFSALYYCMYVRTYVATCTTYVRACGYSTVLHTLLHCMMGCFHLLTLHLILLHYLISVILFASELFGA